jgi:hypothetical protein
MVQEARYLPAVEEVDALVMPSWRGNTGSSSDRQPTKCNYADEFMQLLLEIRDKLNQPELPAAAKLKAALPLMPGILSYEVELDTESSLRRAVQPIKRLFREQLKKSN